MDALERLSQRIDAVMDVPLPNAAQFLAREAIGVLEALLRALDNEADQSLANAAPLRRLGIDVDDLLGDLQNFCNGIYR